MHNDDRIIAAAAGLKTEPGDHNPEYDRALVELSCELLGLAFDDGREYVAALIGVNPS